YGARIQADLVGIENPVSRARRMEELGVDFVGVHLAIDEQMEGKEPFDLLQKIAQCISIPVAVAGGLHAGNVSRAVKAGASILIVGGAITKSQDAKGAVRLIKKALRDKKAGTGTLYRRSKGSPKDIAAILKAVSTANITDAMHRSGDLPGISPVYPGLKMAGKVVTVRTYPGDWAKPVQAVDVAEPGDIIVIDAGGVGPSVWGELATHGAVKKKIGGVVINGAVRDTPEVRALKFPVFAKIIMPRCGEPKGFGEIGVPVNVGGIRVFPGDWAVGDGDGVCIIPADRVNEVANRAMSIFEAENRIRREIDDGSTLAEVTELLKWEKQRE
ncbi:MAG: bifunctional hexulose-6-phosphate synthase/ribonuclease regulator, partial [Candidatus Omnitrophica bacterium]|nr:bifunctional hexulose-6-phosphate synthase/ribonuclease regulator [Candidatus Omnitrophota bacterium]